jgi:hypothetical protein
MVFSVCFSDAQFNIPGVLYYHPEGISFVWLCFSIFCFLLLLLLLLIFLVSFVNHLGSCVERFRSRYLLLSLSYSEKRLQTGLKRMNISRQNPN